MIKTKVTEIRKRDGSIQAFNSGKIENAIFKALEATKSGDLELASRLTRQVVDIIDDKFRRTVPGVENVQYIVEEVLMTQGYPATAKAYILYREQHADLRRLKNIIGVQDDLKLGINAMAEEGTIHDIHTGMHIHPAMSEVVDSAFANLE